MFNRFYRHVSWGVRTGATYHGRQGGYKATNNNPRYVATAELQGVLNMLNCSQFVCF